MAKKLINVKTEAGNASVLTKTLNNKFIICFSLKLESDYNFKKLQIRNLKDFQNFLDKVSNMSIDQVEKLYRRDTDPNDVKKISGIDHQVEHFAINNSFRIHGIYANNMFHVIRLDPNHKFHDK